MNHPSRELQLPENSASNAALAISAIMLGLANGGQEGHYPSSAFLLLATAIVCAIAALYLTTPRWWPKSVPHPDRIALVAAALTYLFITRQDLLGIPRLRIAYCAAACAALATLFGHERPARRAFLVLLVAYAFVAGLCFHFTPSPTIDVQIFQTDAAVAFLHGVNPYTISFPNIYVTRPWVYAPSVQMNGRVMFGYPYLPLTLFINAIAFVTSGDIRYGQLVAILIAAACMAYVRPSANARAAAVCLLFSPNMLFILAKGWIEPIVLMLLAITAFAHERARTHKTHKRLAIAIGLLVVSKQYMPAALLAVPMLLNGQRPVRSWKHVAVVASATAIAITLPLAIWNFPAFWFSVVQLQLMQPFRFDSLSILAWMHHSAFSTTAASTGTPPPLASALAFPALMIAAMLCYLRPARGASAFPRCVAISFLFFFAFNKQAFINYYLLVIGAMWLAVATAHCAPAGDLPAEQS